MDKDNMKPSEVLITKATANVAAGGNTLKLSESVIEILIEVDRIAAAEGNSAAYDYLVDLAYKNDKVLIFVMDVLLGG